MRSFVAKRMTQALEPAWYCIRTQPKHEHIAAANLRCLQGVEVFNPQIRICRFTARGPVRCVEPVFPGYLFVRFVLSLNLQDVKYTSGVSTVVQFADEIPAIPDSVIHELRCTLEAHAETTFAEAPVEGEPVQIAAGPFQGCDAVVSRVLPAKQRVQVLLDVMGRAAAMEMDLSAVLISRPHLARVVPGLAAGE